LNGSTALIEYRYAEGKPERLSELAAELVRLKPDVIVTSSAYRRMTSSSEAVSE
jgi:hypothetical protein